MDHLFYFSGSANKYPGKGANEYAADPNRYLQLNQTPDWRKMLSNFWVAPFESGGLRWNTVEHMYQAYKINVADPQTAGLFALNSGSELSRGGGDVARKNRSIVKLSPDQTHQWEQMKNDVMYAAMYAKFSQNPNVKQVLFLTQDAELWHGAPRTPKSRQFPLEMVRAKLIVEDNGIPTILYEEASAKMQKGEAISINLDPKLDVLTGEVAVPGPATGIPNRMMVLTDKSGQKYIFKSGYDSVRNQILPPV